jgi:hypothetical protein
MEEKVLEKPRVADHLANERTFLAWIRTSIGIMGFGFVVVKFSRFLRQNHEDRHLYHLYGAPDLPFANPMKKEGRQQRNLPAMDWP